MIILKTFNNFSLTDSNYLSTATSAKTPPDANPVFIQQTKADSLYAGTYNLNVRSVAVTVRILDYANWEKLESQLKAACKPGSEGLLVGTFTDENRDYQLNCVVQSIHPIPKYSDAYLIIFQTGESDWQTVSAETDTWEVDASGDTKNLDVGGYSPTRLSLSITPTELPATGWLYQRLYQLVNKPGCAYGVRPWCITLDTAALITAGKMQADGDDIVLLVDGVITKRWLVDINTDHTKIWFNPNLSAGQSMTLLTAVGATGAVSSLAIQNTANNAAALTALPARGFVQHGTEWFEYTGKLIVKKKKKLTGITLTGITRGALGTTLQAHAPGDVFNFIEHAVMLLYGNSAATAPSLDDSTYDNTKPVFDLSASDNTTWVWTAATKFYDPAYPNRTGTWLPGVTRVGNESEIYHTAGDVEGAAVSMGMKFCTWYKAGVKQAEKASLSWMLSNAGGITTVSMTGRKYRNASSWPLINAASLQRTSDAKKWLEVWNEATPTAPLSWQAITHAAAAITGSMKTVRFLLTGSLAALADVDCYFEVATASVVFVSANQPTGTLGTEKSSHLLNVTIKNNTTGDELDLIFPMILNTTLVLDGEAYTVLYGGVDAHSALDLDDDSRAIWIRLNPGTNTLLITGDDVATLTIIPSWLERRM
jgi:hypothetical protein